MPQDQKLNPPQPEPQQQPERDAESIELFQVYSMEELETRTEFRRVRSVIQTGLYGCE